MTDDFPAPGGGAETYHGLVRRIERELGLRAIAPEFEIFTVFFDVPKITPLELRRYFSGSNTAFYQLLGALEARGALSSEPNPADGRSKLYRLSDLVKQQLSTQLRGYRTLGREKSYVPSEPSEVIPRYSRIARTGPRVNMFTADFQILLQIQAVPGISNLECSNLVGVSPSTFNESLRKLRKMGYIFFETDPADKRRKLYYLAEKISEILLGHEHRIFAWLDTKTGDF